MDFFFLDNRYYRDPNDQPDSPEKTHLGHAQMDWLKNRLKVSEAPFKMLITGGGWSSAKGPRGDSWAAFLHERNRLFDFIRDEEISGVVLMAGDSHNAELNVIPWSEHGGYDLYDLESSPIAQAPSGNWLHRRPEARARLPYSQGPNLGIIDFDLSGEVPTLTFNVIDTIGSTVWRPFVLRANELVNGVSSWREKVDNPALRWMRAMGYEID